MHSRSDIDHVTGSPRLDIVDGDRELAPGLSVHAVGGHTAGMQVVSVHTERGTLVLASDASHFYENIEGGHGGAADNEQLAYRIALSFEFFRRYLAS